VSAPTEAMLELADRLEALLEELGDMAMDALRRATSGDPDSAEAGEALALERRALKARRGLDKAIAALREGADQGRVPLDDGAG
jgi:hypothetical protein